MRYVNGRFWRRGASILALLVGALLAVPAQAQPYSALYVFGDSLSDRGNTYAATGGAVPGSPEYYQGRFTNGEVAAELLAQRMGVASHNYAFGGAGTGYGNVFAGLPGLRTQVDAYVAGGPAADPNALYMVWAGANDFIFGFPGDPGAAIAAGVGNIAQAIVDLALQTGARQFLVPNLGNLGRTPLALAQGPDAALQATLLTLAFNDALAQALNGLEAILPIDIVRFDSFGLLEALATAPASYGLGDAGRCFSGTVISPGVACGDPDAHLFWDDVHPSARGQRILEHFMAGQLEVPAPAALVLMLWGAVLLRRRTV